MFISFSFFLSTTRFYHTTSYLNPKVVKCLTILSFGSYNKQFAAWENKREKIVAKGTYTVALTNILYIYGYWLRFMSSVSVTGVLNKISSL